MPAWTPWPADGPGVVELPSGRRVRGRSLRAGLPDVAGGAGNTGQPLPDVAVHAAWRRSAPHPWPVRWVRWPDFALPLVPADARAALVEAWASAATERVEVCCGGGRGRTGTMLAVIAVLDGVPPGDAVRWVQERYHPEAVETPWQRRWVLASPGSRWEHES